MWKSACTDLYLLYHRSSAIPLPHSPKVGSSDCLAVIISTKRSKWQGTFWRFHRVACKALTPCEPVGGLSSISKSAEATAEAAHKLSCERSPPATTAWPILQLFPFLLTSLVCVCSHRRMYRRVWRRRLGPYTMRVLRTAFRLPGLTGTCRAISQISFLSLRLKSLVFHFTFKIWIRNRTELPKMGLNLLSVAQTWPWIYNPDPPMVPPKELSWQACSNGPRSVPDVPSLETAFLWGWYTLRTALDG